ncbi:MAG TPA: prepilin-type N-terminal cleavage/methylation domain-containing protein [Pirellulales bacterium]|jgi:prepilin-type N-terminal cleavage/methylation domain-containing protein|nr:prepilin-type N-terminal cleavage/methylation domain-containing protein [Pirellulales bacterium]
MGRQQIKSGRRHPSSGFTLVELMVVIAIIGLLFVAMMGAMYQAAETAKRARTRQVITKLHNQIMTKWEAYQTRRLPINVMTTTTVTSAISTGSMSQLIAGRQRLGALRELMRLEMPDSYADIQMVSPSGGNMSYLTIPGSTSYMPGDLKNYQAQIGIAGNSNFAGYVVTAMQMHESAECLYLTVKLGSEDPDSTATAISQTETSDYDVDNLKEFSDAWGNPIYWIRWPAGFVSDLQPMFSVPSGDPRRSPNGGQNADPNNSMNLLTRDPPHNHDTFDPLSVDRWEPTTPTSPWPWPWVGNPETGYNLYPLIFSGGPGFDPLIPNASGSSLPLAWDNSQGSPAKTSDPFGVSGKTRGWPYYMTQQGVLAGTSIDPSSANIVHNQTIGNKP